MKIELEEYARLIEGSFWKNSYWFARMLLNNDKYGAVGKHKQRRMLELAGKLEAILAKESLPEQERVKICKTTITDGMAGAFAANTKGRPLALNLARDINAELNSAEDVVVLIVSIRYIVAPMNAAIAAVPSNDLEFCAGAAKDILDTFGEASIYEVLSTWDNLGVRGCLDFERSVVVSEFTKLSNALKSLFPMQGESERNIVLTAFVQEFERRLAQKRKGRAGTSLEDVITFLFDYYNFSSHLKPDHFQTDIEVDKWFRCKDGWSIGISCKRTLRERWKQVSSADSHALSRYKIKEIWHLITYDKDLSDDKLTMLGQQRQVFYLDENSDRYATASAHKGMADYVRPLSQFIADIRQEQMGK